MKEIKDITEKILNETEKIIIGKREQVKYLMTAFLSDGHILLDDVPGTGKTTLVKTLAHIMDCQFNRIQFVSDLMPSDILGINIFNQKSNDFEIKKGAVFTDILLADEINRAMPRTQSALLEAMEERQVTIDGQSFNLPENFTVIATENPVEYESTFNLPIAQLDRFFMKISLGYPKAKDEEAMLKASGDGVDFSVLSKLLDTQKINKIKEKIKDIYVSEEVVSYIVRLVNKTREDGDVLIGASPRATKHLYKASKTWAAMEGRDFVTPDDVQATAIPVLHHRLVMESRAQLNNYDIKTVIKDIISDVEVEK